MLDVERTAISEELEKNGIWYLPLKGSILKDLYPENGMREMADNDVLYDSTKQQKVKELMLSMGYAAESVGKHHHDTYMKPPVLNFELHTVLFGANSGSLYAYYREPQRLMIQDEGKKFGYHMSDEDFYVYVTAHEYKHFSSGGTGIRNLLDCYVFVKTKGDSLDWDHITEQCRQMISRVPAVRLPLRCFHLQSCPSLTTQSRLCWRNTLSTEHMALLKTIWLILRLTDRKRRIYCAICSRQ